MRALLLIVLAGGCSRSALGPGGDGGAADLAHADLAQGDLSGVDLRAAVDLSAGVTDLAGGAAPDLNGASCAMISTATQQYLDGHTACQHDIDCTETNTHCGQPGQCGAYLQQSALAGLMSIEDAWTNAGCMGPCPPCAAPRPAVCAMGACTAGP